MNLEKDFEIEMRKIYREASKIKYYPTRFLQMLDEIGGVQTAKALLSKPGGTEGFARLWELNRLDLSVEYHVLKGKYNQLFSDEERKMCINNLSNVNFNFLNHPDYYSFSHLIKTPKY